MNKEKRCREKIEREKDGETGREVLKKHIEKERDAEIKKWRGKREGTKEKG